MGLIFTVGVLVGMLLMGMIFAVIADLRLEKSISDTVSVRPDGSTIVDTGKLMKKPHIQEMIREMRAKTVQKNSSGQNRPV